MDNTSYVIEVNHKYEGNGKGGSNVTPEEEKSNVEPETEDKEDKEKKKGAKMAKQAAFIGGAVAIGTIRNIGEFTGDYGATREMKNSIRKLTLVASFSNPYTASMAVLGTVNSIVGYSIKKRDNDLRASTLRQISGGINNGYRGRKL